MDREYAYQPSWKVIVFGSLFFGVAALVMGNRAIGNDRGMVLNGLIEFSVNGATIFYWVLTAFSLAFVVMAGFAVILRLTLRQRIVLRESSLTVPRSRWSNEEIEIPFAEIREISESESNGYPFCKIVHGNGSFRLSGALLPRNEDFDEICLAVRQGVSDAESHVADRRTPSDRNAFMPRRSESGG